MLSTKAGGLGINLQTGDLLHSFRVYYYIFSTRFECIITSSQLVSSVPSADTVIMFDADWNPQGLETFSRIALVGYFGNLQSYCTIGILWKLSVVLP